MASEADSTAHRAYWAVPLTGDKLDLHRWEQALPQSFDPWVIKRDYASDSHTLLRSHEFDTSLSRAEVYDRAAEFVEVLNGTLRAFSGARPISIAGIWECMDDGSVKRTLFGEASFRGEGAMAIGVAGNLAPPTRSAPQMWLELANSNPKVREMLHFLGAETNFYDLYKVFECVRSLAGGEGKLKGKPWAIGDLETFKRTADYYHRHARKTGIQAPARQMNLGEAATLMQELARSVLDELTKP